MSIKTKLIAMLVGAALLIGGWRLYQSKVAEIALLNLKLMTQTTLANGTQARLASTTLAKDSLASLVTSEKLLNGKLVAALKIHVPATDTVFVHDSAGTKLLPDSTRVAETKDSSFAGTVTVKAVAPPCCAPLSVTVGLHTPEFNPSVGFVQVGSKYVAVVDWQGKKAQVEAPFVDIEQLPTWGYWAEALYRPLHTSVDIRGGVALRFRHFWSVTAGASTTEDIIVGARKEW